jgi:hypothetical protein
VTGSPTGRSPTNRAFRAAGTAADPHVQPVPDERPPALKVVRAGQTNTILCTVPNADATRPTRLPEAAHYAGLTLILQQTDAYSKPMIGADQLENYGSGLHRRGNSKPQKKHSHARRSPYPPRWFTVSALFPTQTLPLRDW